MYRLSTTTRKRPIITSTSYRLLAHKALKEFDEALNLAEYMKNLFPDRPDGYVFKYTIYKDMNDLEKAEQEKREALNIDPSFVF